MYKFIAALALACAVTLGFTSVAQAQTTQQVKVVYHINTDVNTVPAVLNNIRNHMAADPRARIVVVTHGAGINFLLQDAKDSQGRYILGDPGMDLPPSLFGVPVVASNAITADNVLVASLRQAATFYNREGVVIDMSESDSDNFTKNLVTIRAEERIGLAVYRPEAFVKGTFSTAITDLAS